ncbi:hypothetical protein AwErysi_04030 [Erysipelotrichaceae bacterium]|nr:hypothetical protein AwErysi_04030 [Erysipelotrichaceae bacterium]
MRKITREKVMKLLYTVDVYRQIAKEEEIQTFLHTEVGIELLEQQKAFLLNKKDDLPYFNETFNGVILHLPEIDNKINEYTKKTWSIQQFGFVERSLLRVGMYELYWSEQEGLYPTVIVASILELSEMFVDEKSTKFIHGILGAALNNIPVKDAIIPKARADKYIPMSEDKAAQNKRRFKALQSKRKAEKVADYIEKVEKKREQDLNKI